MKSVIVGIFLLFLSIIPASATGFHFPCFFFCGPPVVTPPPPSIPAPSPTVTPNGNGGNGNWHLCPTPAGWFVCAVTIAIVADEVRRGIEGPACASGKMTRKSYFGTVVDEPKLWRPLCNSKKA